MRGYDCSTKKDIFGQVKEIASTEYYLVQKSIIEKLYEKAIII